MKVELNGKELYHIQNMNLGDNASAFDTFVWSDHFPTREDLGKVFDCEFEGAEGVESMREEFLTTSEIYKVWAEDLEEL